MDKKLKGALIAAAVAGLFAAATARAADDAAMKSEAKGVQCAGKNACKGQGFEKAASAKECSDKGGKVLGN